MTDDIKKINLDVILKPENLKALLEGKKIGSAGEDILDGEPVTVTVTIEMAAVKTNPMTWQELAGAAARAAMVDFATTALLDVEKQVSSSSGQSVDLVGALDAVQTAAAAKRAAQ